MSRGKARFKSAMARKGVMNGTSEYNKNHTLDIFAQTP